MMKGGSSSLPSACQPVGLSTVCSTIATQRTPLRHEAVGFSSLDDALLAELRSPSTAGVVPL